MTMQAKGQTMSCNCVYRVVLFPVHDAQQRLINNRGESPVPDMSADMRKATGQD